jgi:hypothetical protein
MTATPDEAATTAPWWQVRRDQGLSALTAGGRTVGQLSDAERLQLAADLIADIAPGWWPA